MLYIHENSDICVYKDDCVRFYIQCENQKYFFLLKTHRIYQYSTALAYILSYEFMCIYMHV